MDEYCKDKGFTQWFETSAKENINIDEAARCLVSKVIAPYLKELLVSMEIKNVGQLVEHTQ